MEEKVQFNSFVPDRAQFVFPDLRLDGYDQSEVANQLSEAHLRQAIERGARILRVVVVTLTETTDFIPYLKLSDRAGFSRLSTRRYEGPKTFKDFRILQRSLLDFGFNGGIFVYPEGHRFLQILG